MLVVGLMSGTSLDGVVGGAFVPEGVGGRGFGPALTGPVVAGLRERRRRLLDRAGGIGPEDPALVGIERELTEVYASAVAALDVRAGLIGMHGQTILHRPEEGRTWQIGDASLLTSLTGVPVVHDFRSSDMRAGGEGAPLAPLFHAAMLPDTVSRPVAVLNVGGVANLTFVGTDGVVVACDTGPGNALIDDWVGRHTGLPCDVDGRLALAGALDEGVLARLLDDPYFRRRPPKSLDRLHFQHALSAVEPLSVEDGAATLTAFTARAVAATQLPATPLAWFVCGGGRRNPALMRALAACLSGSVQPVEEIGWEGDALEAQCFGFLAVRSVLGLPLSIPGTTGVRTAVTGGLLCKAGPGALPPAGPGQSSDA